MFDSYYGEGDLSTVEEFENINGITFPDKYREIVRSYNGAYILNKNLFSFPSQLVGHEVEYGSGMFLPFGEIEGVTETMEIKKRYPPEGFVSGLIMFSSLGNGDALCFDYRSDSHKDNPPVVVWHHEGSPGGDDEISAVASSFQEFLDMLYEDDDDDDD
jgi:hypothetical protein